MTKGRDVVSLGIRATFISISAQAFNIAWRSSAEKRKVPRTVQASGRTPWSPSFGTSAGCPVVSSSLDARKFQFVTRRHCSKVLENLHRPPYKDSLIPLPTMTSVKDLEIGTYTRITCYICVYRDSLSNRTLQLCMGPDNVDHTLRPLTGDQRWGVQDRGKVV